jgi:RHS repeat-associated protein
MEKWRTGSCLIVVLLATFLSSAALGQTQTTDVPIRQFQDSNGVDLLSGTFTTATGVAVGDAENGLAFTRVIRGAYALDNMLGEIVAGATTTVRLHGRAEQFTQSGSVFTPVEQNGSTLTLSGGTYTYRTADGTTSTFSVPPANYYQYGNAKGIVPNTTTYPNGKVLTFSYAVGSTNPPGSPVPVYGRRLAGVYSNTGYYVTFAYETNVLSSTTIHLWIHVVTVNTGTSVPAPAAGPSLTISPITGETPGVRDYTDAMGRTTRYTFSGGVSAIRFPSSPSNDVTVAYSSGKVSSVTAAGVTTTYSYSDAGNIRTTTVTRGSNPSGNYKFDLTKLVMTWHQNEAGHVTQYTYDPSNRPFRVTMPEGNFVEYGYDARGNVTNINEGPKPSIGGGYIYRFIAGYDAPCTVAVKCNRPNWTKDAKGNQTDYTYDPTHGGVLTVTAPEPTTGAVRPQTRTTYVQVNSSGVEGSVGVFKPKTISACQTSASCAGTTDEAKTTFGYGNNQNVASVTAALGTGSVSATTAFTYDAAGNVTSVDGPQSGTADQTLAAYNAARQPLWQIGPDPDGAGAALFPAVKYTYRTNGQVDYVQSGTVTVQSQAGMSSFSEVQRQTSSYDGYHRPIRQALSSAGASYQITDVRYDAVGRVECSMVRMNPVNWGTPASNCDPTQPAGTDGPDRVTYNHYDALSRVWKVTSGYGVTGVAADEYTATFTANGKLATLKDAESNLTTYEYDGYDRRVKTRFPVTNKGANESSATDYEQISYDANGNVSTFRTRRAETIQLTYDNLDRLIIKDVPVRSGLAATHTRDVYFGYDLFGNMTYARFDSASGEGITSTFDALGQLASAINNMDGISRTLTYDYDGVGRRTKMIWPDGFYSSNGYLTNVVSQIRENSTTPGLKVLASYSYDNLGRRTQQALANGVSSNYSYDAVSRLSAWSHNVGGADADVGTSFTYNPANQIASATRNNDLYAWNGQVNADLSYTPDGLNRYTGASFSYDDNGNLTSDSANTFVYDVENRLVTRSGGASATLRYDPLGRLHEVVSGGNTRRFLYDGSDLVAEYNASGSLQRRYVHGLSAGDDPLVWFEGSGSGDSARRYLYADERGSTIAVRDSAGAVLNVNTYDEYGVPGSANVGAFQYTGQVWLPELGMYYYKARMYSPLLGRFMQTDPIGYGDGMNMYAYVGNDPANFADPSGLGGCYTISWSNQVRGSSTTVEPHPDNGTPGGSESNTRTEYYSVTICTDGTIRFGGGGGGDSGGGGGPQGAAKKGAWNKFCSKVVTALDSRLGFGGVTLDSDTGRQLLGQYFRSDATPYQLSDAEWGEATAYVNTYGSAVLGTVTTTRADGLVERRVDFGRIPAGAPVLAGVLGSSTGIFNASGLVGLRDSFNFDLKDRGPYPYGPMANAGVRLIRADAVLCGGGKVSIPVTGGAQ